MTPLLPRLLCRHLALLVCFYGLLVPAASTNSGWLVRTWKSDEGLPNNHVTGLAQTPDGYLWVATFSRPARFDGVQFEEYFLRDFNIPANQKITALQLSRDGLWLGTSHGEVIRLDSTSTRVFTNGFPDKVTQTLTEDGDGSLWTTYQGGAVCRLKDGQVTSFTVEDGLPPAELRDQNACSLARDTRGRIWFAKSGHLGIFRNGRFETLLPLPGPITRLAAARGGGVWICSGGRLMKFDEGEKMMELAVFDPGDVNSEPSVLLEDHHGGVWIGTADRGLFRYDDGRLETVPTSDQRITSLAEDREGNIWAGTDSGGLDRLRPRAIGLETVETGLPSGTVQSLCEETNGTVWATTQNGLLLCLKDGAWKTLSTNTDWPGGRATCVATDRSGGVWVGTKDHALHCLRGGHFTTLGRAEGMVGREIHALLPDKNGDLWIGEESPDVVQRLHDGKLETFLMPPNVRIIRTMTEDAANNIWVGTSGGILARIANGVVTDETPRTTGTPLSIRCLRATADGGLWIGYADEGVGWLKDGRFKHLTVRQNFPEENVSQIIADDGWLWFGGDHGIFKVRQKELESLATGHAVDVNDIRYGQSEGLSSLEANCGDSPGAIRSVDGRLWIPMRTALAIVSPGRLNEDPQSPLLLLKRVAVDDQVVALYGGVAPVREGTDLRAVSALRLPAGYHRLKFEFTAPSFGAPENVRFRYKLDGFDDAWINGGGQRVANYSRLAPGNYLFHVTACSRTGVWSEKGATFAFAVAPFVWQTWWFRVIAPVIFTALVVALVRYISFRRLRLKLQKLEQQAALDKERSRIARDIHDDIGGRLTEVELLLESANRTPREKWNGQMHRISATVRQVGESLDEIVWAVNPRHDTLPHLMDYLGQYAIQFCQAAGVRCRMDFPDEFPRQIVPPETRHNLFLAVKEALNNVVRHARATETWLRVSLAEDRLKIVVEDNGAGFNGAAGDLCADGLRNMRRRMEEIGGEFGVETRPDAGTRVSFTLPLPEKDFIASSIH